MAITRDRKGLGSETHKKVVANNYEAIRSARIEQNNAKFRSLGIPSLIQSVHRSSKKSMKKEKRKMVYQSRLVDEEEDVEENSDGIKFVTSKKKHEETAQPKVIRRSIDLPVSKKPQIASTHVSIPTNAHHVLRDDEIEDDVNSISDQDDYDSDDVMQEELPSNNVPLDEMVPEDSQSASVKRTRGPTQCYKLLEMSSRHKLPIELNEFAQPIGPPENATYLSSYLGTLARNYKLAPLYFADWKQMEPVYKDIMWERVTKIFNIDEKAKAYVMRTIGDNWRGYKCRLKKKCFKPYSTHDEWKSARPRGIPTDCWEALIKFWNSKEEKETSERNSESRLL